VADADHQEPKPELDIPPAAKLDEVCTRNRFLLEGEHGNLWFEYRSSTLFVTFDNLATLDAPYPRMPWMHDRVEMLGASLLGVQSFRKDWFRQPTTPMQIAGLVEQGFFERFDRIVFVGASMGAFAALNFAPLVRGAWVLAFSPQSTMNQRIAPFEKRFTFAVKRSDWGEMPFLDAAAAVPYIPKVALFYDPLEDEDKLHAARLAGPNVQTLPCLGSSHQAIRLVVKCDALPQMMNEFAQTGRLGYAFFNKMRARKQVRSWRKSIVEKLKKQNHPKLLLRTCDIFLAEKHYAFAQEARAKMLKDHPDLKAKQ
jgi:hypothetical protein